jgi:hypothetical protein
MKANSHRSHPHDPKLPRLLFPREPGWQFSLMLALDVVFLFAVAPALSTGQTDRGIMTILQFALAAVAIALIAKSTWFRLGLAASFALTLLARFLPGLLPHITTLSMAFVYNFLVTVATARAVFGPGTVNHHRIAGAVFVYLNLALLFALAYGVLRAISPMAISGLPDPSQGQLSELIHLSVTSLTGLGDPPVRPDSAVARSLMDLEAMIGQLFPAIVLSRLVGLHLSHRDKNTVETGKIAAALKKTLTP